MNNLLLLPIVIPAMTGALLILFVKHRFVLRAVSAAAVVTAGLAALAVGRYVLDRGGLTMVELGGWPAPFGIVLVADRLTVTGLAVAALVAICTLFFAFRTLHPDRERHYFYSFFFFLLTGVNGSFLTGDLFNLFVFFEVMLLSSYALIAIGGTKQQLREAFIYVMLNIFASMLFLIGIAYLYGITGTVNMAHLAVRLQEAGQTGALKAVAVIFFLVFAMKGALFPLYFWLPRAYSSAPTAILALFGGLLTKVGVYALVRTFTLIFTHDVAFTHHSLLLTLAGLTMLFGVFGALGKTNIKRILAYMIISHIGYIVIGLGLFTEAGLAGTVYYYVQDIVVITALLMFSGAIQHVTGTVNFDETGGVMQSHPLLGWLFLIPALSLAGTPPLSGFFGKLTLVLASLQEGRYTIAAVAMVVGLLTLFAMFRVFIHVFWGEPKLKPEQMHRPVLSLLVPILPLVALTIALGLGAQWMHGFALDIAGQLMNPSDYIHFVLRQ